MVKFKSFKGLKVLLPLIVAVIYFHQGTLMAEAPAKTNSKPDIAQLAPVTKDDRVLIMAPHPDDESLAAGGLIQRALKAGADVKILYLTNGEHNQLAFIVYAKRIVIKQKALIGMGRLRQSEAQAAMKLLGVPEENLIFLGYPDFGTLAIFLRYWGDLKPFRNMLTRVSNVPYQNALSPNAPYKGEAILWDIESVLRKYKPTKIFVTNSVDTNRDHKALYIFLRVALWDLKGQIPEPEVYPYLIHCYGWPKPRHYHPSLFTSVPKVLRRAQMVWLSHDLSPEEVEQKHKAILLYKSQCADSAFYLTAFARRNELFCSYPDIDAGNAKPMELSRDKPVFYGAEDGKLAISIYMRETGPRKKFYVHLAGYNPDVEFSKMPKIKINVDGDRFHVLDRGQFLTKVRLEVARGKNFVTIKVPLEILGDPQYVLTSAKVYNDIFSPDMNAWRVVKIK